MAPSEIPSITPRQSIDFGSIVELFVTSDYCSLMGCAPFATDYFDSPAGPAPYIAFIAAHNHLTRTQIATLAVLSTISLNRPDILTDKPGRKEFEEIKPNSVTGRAAGRLKVGNLIGFYGIWSLPYVPGVTYVPTPETLIGVAPGGVEVFLRLQRLAPGLIVYDICVRGDSKILTLYAIIAILLLIIAIILSRGRILRGGPIPIPALAMSSGGSSGSTSATSAPELQAKYVIEEPTDLSEREADIVAANVAKT